MTDAGQASRAAQLADERFVALTTYRRDGTPVVTTVWVGADDGDLVVTTPAGSGKVKRLRRNPRVEIIPCGRGGAVKDTAVPLVATVTIIDAATEPGEFARLSAVFPAKYGLEYRAMMVIEKVVTRGKGAQRIILRMRPV